MELIAPSPFRIHSLYSSLFPIAILVALTLLFGQLVIQNFKEPLSLTIGGDVDQWEYMGYYIANNLTFNPLPHINLTSNQTFYPYGTNHVFQGWAFESNLWYAVLYQLAGLGAWLNFYYLLSIFILTTGTYLLLRSQYGETKALLASLFVSFFNFYAVNKYPGHFAYAIIHWTVLSIITDFLLVQRIVFKRPIPIRFILLKGLLLVLCLGQDVAYVLGFALTSFTISSLYGLIILSITSYRNKESLKQQIATVLTSWKNQWVSNPLLHNSLVLLAIFFSLLYVPLLWEVYHQASLFQFVDRFAGGHGWTHPARLLLPYFSSYNALLNPFTEWLHDMPEGNGAGSPGWFLLLAGGIGFWQSRRKMIWVYVPLLVFCLLHAFYHPIRVPILQVFPWCRFNRIPARVTVIYPVVLTFFALHISFKKDYLQRIITTILIVIGSIELYTVYSFRYAQKPYHFANTFFSYMDRVKKQPGEAVLDWPFCVIGGNTTGGVEGLCPLYNRTANMYALKRFHTKRTVGQYFGRLHDSQIQPFLKAGWPQLLNHPDTVNIMVAERLTTCFTEQEWRFFTKFYQLNNFAGINLCIDLLPKDCLSVFYARFGRPVAQTVVPGVGRIVFIPKLIVNSDLVNRQKGRLLRLAYSSN
jgi:hypothetical protein